LILASFLKDILYKILNKLKILKEMNIEKVIKGHNSINEILSEIRSKTESARTSIIQFHNGDYYSNGTPIVKFSMGYESCSLGVSSHINETKDYLLSNYSGIEEAIENKNTIINTHELKNTNFKSFLLEKNTITFYSFPIRSHKNHGNIIGIFFIEWCSKDKIKNINISNIENMCNKYCGILQNLINKEK
jgi:hypothetical protein